MPATPRRKLANSETQSPAQSLVGQSVTIPLDIFKESQAQYTGKVVGTPRRKNAVYVKVDQDDTEYWFPADQVAKWVVEDTKPAIAAATPKTPRARKQGQRTDSPQGASTAASSQPANMAGRHKRRALQSSGEHVGAQVSAQQTQDAASCHPEKPDTFAETIEGLVRKRDCACLLLQVTRCSSNCPAGLQAATSTDELNAVSCSLVRRFPNKSECESSLQLECIKTGRCIAWLKNVGLPAGSVFVFACSLVVLAAAAAAAVKSGIARDWMQQTSHLWSH